MSILDIYTCIYIWLYLYIYNIYVHFAIDIVMGPGAAHRGACMEGGSVRGESQINLLKIRKVEMHLLV